MRRFAFFFFWAKSNQLPPQIENLSELKEQRILKITFLKILNVNLLEHQAKILK